MTVRRGAGLAVVLLLVVAACGGPAGDSERGAPETATDAPGSAPVGPDEPEGPVPGSPGAGAPSIDGPEVDLGPLDFVAEGVLGGQVVGAELAGSDLVVWFWAPW